MASAPHEIGERKTRIENTAKMQVRNHAITQQFEGQGHRMSTVDNGQHMRSMISGTNGVECMSGELHKFMNGQKFT